MRDAVKRVDHFIAAYAEGRVLVEDWPRIKKYVEEALTKAPNSQSKQCQCGELRR